MSQLVISNKTNELYQYNLETHTWDWIHSTTIINNIIMKHLTDNNLMDNIYDDNYITNLGNKIKDQLRQNTINKPFHRDLVSNDHYLEYNLFPGFTASKVVDYDNRLYRILHYINHTLANKDQEVYHTILSWLAKPLQTFTSNDQWLILSGPDLLFFERFISLYVYSPVSEVVRNLDEVHDTTLLVTMYVNNLDEIKSTNKNGSVMVINNNKSIIPNSININTRKVNAVYLKDLIEECFNQEVGDMMYTYLRSYDVDNK